MAVPKITYEFTAAREPVGIICAEHNRHTCSSLVEVPLLLRIPPALMEGSIDKMQELIKAAVEKMMGELNRGL